MGKLGGKHKAPNKTSSVVHVSIPRPSLKSSSFVKMESGEKHKTSYDRSNAVHVAAPHGSPRGCCTPVKIALAVMVMFLVVGGIIGIIVFFVFAKKPPEPTVAPSTCGNGYKRTAYTSTGVTCTDIDECDDHSTCPPGNQCRNLPGSYECQPCGPGHVASPDGRSCLPSQVTTPTTTPPCQQPGICAWKPFSQCYSIGTSPGYLCLCRPGYWEKEGKCQIPTEVTPPTHHCLQPQACSQKPNSVCTPIGSSGAYECVCAQGYVDISTECVAPSRCDPNPCMNWGACVIRNQKTTCLCPAGYSGDNCEIVNLCAKNPCLNGVCSEAFDGFYCTCVQGWAGDLCDEPVSECTNLPCQNGRCISGNGDFLCVCDRGWEGTLCDIESNDCAEAHCEPSHSTCLDGELGYTCICFPGWQGTWCDVPIDDCRNTGCDRNNSVCIDDHLSYSCRCDFGWTGEYCDEPVGPCDLDINTLLWEPDNANCLSGFNNEIVNVGTNDMAACKAACEAASYCCSVDYNASTGQCNLSSDNAFSQAAAYLVPCSAAAFIYSEVAGCRDCPGLT